MPVIIVCSAHSRTIVVPTQQPTIQAGIDVAVGGDTVLVEPGTYVENIDFLGKAIVLFSSGGKEFTFIESADAGTTIDLSSAVDSSEAESSDPSTDSSPIVYFHRGEQHSSILDGFTIRYSVGEVGIWCYFSSPTIQNCEISHCYNDGDGGGIWCVESAAIIRNNLIHHNQCGITGAGIMREAVTDEPDGLEVVT